MNIVITGTTSGIGAATAEALAEAGHHLWLLNRNPQKSASQKNELLSKFPKAKIETITCDLANLNSVRTAASALQNIGPVDVLINNAGGLTSQREVTVNGHEMQFQMNHLGHFLLTNSLLPQLLAAKGKIINVSSEAHRAGRLNPADFQLEKGWSAFGAYANAKLCNVLFTAELHKRYQAHGLQAFALHPGVVNTGFGNGLGGMKWMWALMRPFLITPAKGAATTLHLTSSKNLVSGGYYKNRKLHKAAPAGRNEALATELWQYSESLIR
jgi:NAD(P)-dependent dehydrogenase (short-subunit alcohol dehydrogenase family)